MARILRLAAAGCLSGLLLPTPLYAQAPAEEPGSTARLQLGPLGLTPKIALRNLGVDTNVFNASDAPEKDFTAALVPGVDAWLRLGRARLTSRTAVEWNYFHKATHQRSFNLNQDGRVDLDLTRLVPFVSGSYVRTRQRPNLEIDQRVQQKRTSAGAGLVFRAGARLELEAGLQQSRMDFGQTKFGSAELAQVLNRDVKEGGLSLKYEVTPLTTFVVRTAARYDRFEFVPERDSDSISVLPGFEFSPSALISGTALVGVRRFRTLDATVPDYSGLIASVDVKYVVRDMTRFVLAVGRDVEYSFEVLQPFYVSTERRLEVTQVVGYYWDAVGRVSLGTLSYKGLLQDIGAVPDRKDRVLGYGAGFGRRFGDDLRIGIDVDYAKRTSDRDARVFDGMRVGGSVTYGY